MAKDKPEKVTEKMMRDWVMALPMFKKKKVKEAKAVTGARG